MFGKHSFGKRPCGKHWWTILPTLMAQSLALMALLLGSAAMAAPMGPTLKLAPGDQEVLNFPARVTKVATSDPKVMAVTVSGDQELLITAKAKGTAILSVWVLGHNQPLRSNVVVANTLGAALPFGTQVQTNIKVLEVSRSKLNSLGIYYASLFNGGESAIGIAPPGSGYRGFSGPMASQGPLNSQGFNLFAFGSDSLAIISALESGGFAYTLAEPTLTTLSGQSASFLAGGEFPVPTKSTNNGVQIEYKEYGIGLSLTPTVISRDQIILKVAPEVSELDFSAGVKTGGVSVPGLTIRRAETTVSLAPGETFIISGLVSRSTINNSDRIPGLGDIPILGAFFRSSRIARNDKELVMVVTPYLVTPRDAASGPPIMPGGGYRNSSMKWLDMATDTGDGSQPIRHGLSW